jgi:hypothetical protein
MHIVKFNAVVPQLKPAVSEQLVRFIPPVSRLAEAVS